MKETEKRSKRDYVWNTAAGLINAAEAVIMSMVVTRMTGLADAGMLTMAFAVGNLMMPIGKFGMRNYQVTDVEDRFSFSTYLTVRIITVVLMIIAICGYLGCVSIKGDYSLDKIEIIFAICMIYAVEALEDVIWGYYQRRNRLYVGSGMFCFRWIGILISFSVMLYITRKLAFTLIACLGISIVIFFVLLGISYPRLCREEDRIPELIRKKIDFMQIRQLLRAIFPLFGISFLSFYENNAPKYAIDACLTDEMQACYGFVAMPVFVIGLLNNFIYQPTLVPMAVEWEQGESKKFRNRIVKQIITIGGITIVCVTGAYFLGIPVLSLLYNTDLTGYKRELMILILASAFLALSGYQNVVLTIMRCQKVLLLPHCLAATIAAAGLHPIVLRYKTMGAASFYLLLMMILCLSYGSILIIKLRRNKISLI